MKKARAPVLAALASLLATAPPALGEEVIEEVIVTGSYIRGTPEDAASPVSVMSREDMDMKGNPSVLEILKNLGPSSGIDGETNQFQSNGLEGISNVNLRGLGPARTLVLLNGTRMVVSPYAIGETGQLFVNTNAIPAIALQRLELLKDGASATYGSDAIAGVVNFITRSDFRGLEVMGNFKDIDESDGDYELGAIVGFGNDTTDVVISAGYQSRSELAVRDLDWTLAASPAENPRGGFSGIPNPSRFLTLATGGLTFDPDCETVGGFINGTACNFRFTDFDNIAEEEEHYQIFVELNHEFASGMGFHGEVLYARDDVPEWKTSPSYPPQSLFSTDRYVGPGMPHFDDFVARNPSLAGQFAGGALVLGRTFGVSGPAQEGYREYDTYRFSGGLTGEFDNGVSWNLDATYGVSEAERSTNDTRIDNLAFAYRGLGGPNCDPNTGTPGAGSCMYYNPFTSGYPTSMSATAFGVASPGGDNAALNNSRELYDWLVEGVGTEVTSELFVLDFVMAGDTSVAAAGGYVSWAAGIQYRREDYEVDPFDNSDVTVTPCPFGIDTGDTFTRGADGVALPFSYNCTGTGAFHFLAAASPYDLDQDIIAVFGELAVPLFENVDLQLAVRYEDYGGSVGNTVDPKVAVRWDVTPEVTLRGSLGSSFRGPSLNQLQGRGTTLQFIAPTNAFKAVDTTGNPDLAPEEAITTNFGIVWQPNDNVFASLDWWYFDFSDPIVIEPAGDIVQAFVDQGPEKRLAVANDAITFQDPANPSAATIQRVDVTYQNGPDVETGGVDWALTWDVPLDAGILTFGSQGTWIERYKVDAWLFADGFDAEGLLNRFTYVRPLPEIKANQYVSFSFGNHNLRLDHYYIDEYEDADAPTGVNWDIDAHHTFDMSYNFRFNDDNTRVFLAVYNLTDEEPPFARLDLNYDPYTHNPYGRMIKFGVQHDFAGLFE